jgi:hypothetical protein
MTVAEVRKIADPFDRLLYWVRERESVRLKKEKGLSRPWTDDWILHTYRFCSVRRMDDKVSRWLLKEWYTPYRDHPNTVAAAACARMFNKPETLEWFPNYLYGAGPPNWVKVKQEAKARRANGHTVFNGAYVVSTSGNRADKVEWVVDRYLTPLTGMTVPTGTMAAAHAALARCYGFSSFMAGQVVADLRHAMSGQWADRRAWAPVGPGSKRGLARLGRRPDELAAVVRDVLDALPAEIASRLEAMDVQSCLCEYDKYERAFWNEGKPKQLYRGGA